MDKKPQLRQKTSLLSFYVRNANTLVRVDISGRYHEKNMTIEIGKTPKFILSLDHNFCKTCGKDSTNAVQLYPSQAWEYYCSECYGKKNG
jgi:hypothetical protein